MIDDQTHAAADAIEEVVRKSTVGIVSGSGDQLWLGIGTGTLIHWRNGYFILTAEHVVGNTGEADLRFFLPLEAPPPKVDRETLLTLPGLPTSALHPFAELNLGPVFRDLTLDLAALTVSPSIESVYPAKFFDLSENGADPHENQTSLVFGFPYDISRVLQDKSRAVFTYLDWQPVVANRTGLANFDPAVHFLASYSEAESYPDANPKGLSGSARWGRKGSTPEVWHPNVDILGVTVTYYEKQALLKMVRRKTVMEFLKTIHTGRLTAPAAACQRGSADRM